MSTEFDVVVIGAGIHGVGIAQVAAAAGYSVRVLEQSDEIAQGTSRASSKLIHGGLRYLETAQFSLVRECLAERATLLRNAPELVSLKPFVIPIYPHTTRRPLIIRAGLSLYALLGGLREDSRFRKLKRSEWDNLDGLETKNLQAVYQYFDAQTDDALLSRAVMQSAVELGAECVLGAEVTAMELGDHGSTIRYVKDGQEHECRAQTIANAAGPWVNEVLARAQPPQQGPAIELVQGAHIVVPAAAPENIYYVEAPRDRRAVFVMSRGEHTMVGTTENAYSGDPAGIKALDSEIDYLLETLQHYFPLRAANQEDIVSSFAGARVLPVGEGSHNSRKRETTMPMDNPDRPRLISIYGGKLTAYHATAEKVMRKLQPGLPARQAKADTRQLRLRPA